MLQKAFGFAGLFFSASTALAAPNLLPPDSATTHYLSEEVTTTDGLRLNAQLALPKGRKGPFPAVLLLVGSGTGNRYEAVPGAVTADGKPSLLFKGIEQALVDQGIAVFSYDKRGVSPKDATFQDSDVDWNIFSKTADAVHLASDALRAFDVLSLLPEVDPSRIAVLGHSEGTALGMKIAEARSKVRSLYMLGLWTRSTRDLLRFQFGDQKFRLFEVMDLNQDGKITESEFAPFSAEAPEVFPSWAELLKQLDADGDGTLSLEEIRTRLEQQGDLGLKQIEDPRSTWSNRMPREWFQQYFAEGSLLDRHAQFCSKTRVYQGEIDVQTPYEDAVALRDRCLQKGTPLASLHGYANEGHGFSPRTGLRGWRDTVGPMDPQVARDIAREAAVDLLTR